MQGDKEYYQWLARLKVGDIVYLKKPGENGYVLQPAKVTARDEQGGLLFVPPPVGVVQFDSNGYTDKPVGRIVEAPESTKLFNRCKLV